MIGCLRNNGWRHTIDKITKKAIRFSLLRTLDLISKTWSESVFCAEWQIISIYKFEIFG